MAYAVSVVVAGVIADRKGLVVVRIIGFIIEIVGFLLITMLMVNNSRPVYIMIDFKIRFSVLLEKI